METAEEAALAGLLKLSPNNDFTLPTFAHPTPKPYLEPDRHYASSSRSQNHSEEAYRCICNSSYDDGWSVACDECGMWMHGSCFGFSETNPVDRKKLSEEEWWCWICRPRPVDKEYAVKIQRERQLMQEDERERERRMKRLRTKHSDDEDGKGRGAKERARRKTSPGVERKPRRASTVAANGSTKRRRRSSNAASQHPPPTQHPSLVQHRSPNPWPVPDVSEEDIADDDETEDDRNAHASTSCQQEHQTPFARKEPPPPPPSSSRLEQPRRPRINTSKRKQPAYPDPKAHAYSYISRDVVPHVDTRDKLKRQAQGWRGVSAVASNPAALRDPTTPVLLDPHNYPGQSNIRVETVPPHPELSTDFNTHSGVVPPNYGLYMTQDVGAATLITPFTSTIVPSAVYLSDALNAYAHLGVPKMGVHLLGGGNNLDERLDIALDARATGNAGRFARNGCKPNAILKPIVWSKPNTTHPRHRKQEGGSEDESDPESMTFGIFALDDLSAGDEIVLGWEWDDGHAVHSLPSVIAGDHFSILTTSHPHDSSIPFHQCHCHTASPSSPSNASPTVDMDVDAPLPSNPTRPSQEKLDHLRNQMTSILHAFGASAANCACGSDATDCALYLMGRMADGLLKPGDGEPVAEPTALPTDAGSWYIEQLKSRVPGGPLLGATRGLRTCEPRPDAGGMEGVRTMVNGEILVYETNAISLSPEVRARPLGTPFLTLSAATPAKDKGKGRAIDVEEKDGERDAAIESATPRAGKDEGHLRPVINSPPRRSPSPMEVDDPGSLVVPPEDQIPLRMRKDSRRQRAEFLKAKFPPQMPENEPPSPSPTQLSNEPQQPQASGSKTTSIAGSKEAKAVLPSSSSGAGVGLGIDLGEHEPLQPRVTKANRPQRKVKPLPKRANALPSSSESSNSPSPPTVTSDLPSTTRTSTKSPHHVPKSPTVSTKTKFGAKSPLPPLPSPPRHRPPRSPPSAEVLATTGPVVGRSQMSIWTLLGESPPSIPADLPKVHFESPDSTLSPSQRTSRSLSVHQDDVLRDVVAQPSSPLTAAPSSPFRSPLPMSEVEEPTKVARAPSPAPTARSPPPARSPTPPPPPPVRKMTLAEYAAQRRKAEAENAASTAPATPVVPQTPLPEALTPMVVDSPAVVGSMLPVETVVKPVKVSDPPLSPVAAVVPVALEPAPPAFVQSSVINAAPSVVGSRILAKAPFAPSAPQVLNLSSVAPRKVSTSRSPAPVVTKTRDISPSRVTRAVTPPYPPPEDFELSDVEDFVSSYSMDDDYQGRGRPSSPRRSPVDDRRNGYLGRCEPLNAPRVTGALSLLERLAPPTPPVVAQRSPSPRHYGRRRSPSPRANSRASSPTRMALSARPHLKRQRSDSPRAPSRRSSPRPPPAARDGQYSGRSVSRKLDDAEDGDRGGRHRDSLGSPADSAASSRRSSQEEGEITPTKPALVVQSFARAPSLSFTHGSPPRQPRSFNNGPRSPPTMPHAGSNGVHKPPIVPYAYQAPHLHPEKLLPTGPRSQRVAGGQGPQHGGPSQKQHGGPAAPWTDDRDRPSYRDIGGGGGRGGRRGGRGLRGGWHHR